MGLNWWVDQHFVGLQNRAVLKSIWNNIEWKKTLLSLLHYCSALFWIYQCETLLKLYLVAWLCPSDMVVRMRTVMATLTGWCNVCLTSYLLLAFFPFQNSDMKWAPVLMLLCYLICLFVSATSNVFLGRGKSPVVVVSTLDAHSSATFLLMNHISYFFKLICLHKRMKKLADTWFNKMSLAGLSRCSVFRPEPGWKLFHMLLWVLIFLISFKALSITPRL